MVAYALLSSLRKVTPKMHARRVKQGIDTLHLTACLFLSDIFHSQ